MDDDTATSAEPYRHVHLADLGGIPPAAAGDPVQWIPVRDRLGISAFGVNAFAGHAVGDLVIERHDEIADDGEPDHEELYVVLAGELDFSVGDDRFRAVPGDAVFLRDPALVREAHATVVPALVLAVGAAPGTAFTPSSWETRELAARDAAADR
jgi:hypothetical protein